MRTRTAEAIAEAVTRAGGLAQLGERLGVAHSQVCRWRKSGRVPANRVAAIGAATGVPRHLLRPDLFGAPARAPAPVAWPGGMAALAEEVRALGLDPDRVVATALADAVGVERNRRWAEENREAIDAHRRHVEEHGVPLGEYRMF